MVASQAAAPLMSLQQSTEVIGEVCGDHSND
jgi:hypothetical protein